MMIRKRNTALQLEVSPLCINVVTFRFFINPLRNVSKMGISRLQIDTKKCSRDVTGNLI